MAYEIKNNTGVLYKNDKKSKDNAPDFTGTVNIEGKTWRIAGWTKKAQETGNAYLSLKISEPMGKTESADADEFLQNDSVF